ncbi:hypothetical protein KBZ20_16335 [Vulcanococcus limneticus Candia 3F8]|uniref:hypothetical protein n=1 Tax=Vulcanococcus limneticus TaxID=2170428 RepID=UPI0020CF0458|nr:hypothetical protein [Vulcanococcus limneticus]MCP9793333.1 hypothetical protein [Vulcanococcus limneticus MW73D5]MCP9895335.1 hypothetical protein [Vulcanococcus limneticus Candia 3F8]MCP9898731.1 hypothetical protein [Vulcanococcus limneticus Candia 3B3]
MATITPSLTAQQQERASQVQSAGISLDQVQMAFNAAYETALEDLEDLAASQPVLDRYLRGEEKTYTRAEMRAVLGLDA